MASDGDGPPPLLAPPQPARYPGNEAWNTPDIQNPKPLAKHLTVSAYLTLTATLRGTLLLAHFRATTEAQISGAHFLGSHNQEVAEPGFEPRT